MVKLVCLVIIAVIIAAPLLVGWYVMRDAPPVEERHYSFTNITPGAERVPCICGLVLALAVVAAFILGKADDIDKANRM